MVRAVHARCTAVRVELTRRQLPVQNLRRDDVLCRNPGACSAELLDQSLLVHDEVHRLADMDVIERRNDQVHREVPRAVTWVDVELVLQVGIREVLREDGGKDGCFLGVQ